MTTCPSDPEITLDENHIYRVDGIRKPSVSAILQSTGIVDTTFFTEYGATRGTFAHKATELHDLGDLNEDDLDKTLLPYLEAWKRYRAESGFVPSMIEKKLYSRLGFCGTIDRFGQDNSGSYILPDIKTGYASQWWHVIQLAAYRLLVGEAVGHMMKVLIVHLHPNGKYKLQPYTMQELVQGQFNFMSALRIVSARINAGVFWRKDDEKV
ncbi:MAG: hypothetical protein ABGX83_05330 [Nitrospira sp.]